MSEEYYDAELEEIKRRRMEQRIRQAQEAKIREQEELIKEAQRQAILRRIMTPKARERLANVKLVRPDLARSVEDYLIGLALSGRLGKILTDEDLKEILIAIDSRNRREVNIRIREKR